MSTPDLIDRSELKKLFEEECACECDVCIYSVGGCCALLDKASAGRTMTPEQFFEKVQKICRENICDNEVLHDKTDFLMEELLISLGYKEGVELIRSMERWYA